MTKIYTYNASANKNIDQNLLVFFAINPGPANALLPLVRKLSDSKIGVLLRFGEPAASIAKRYLPDLLQPCKMQYRSCKMLITCGHVNNSLFVKECIRAKKANKDLKIITIDDNFDSTIPLIEKMIASDIWPDLSFVMNKSRIKYLDLLIKDRKPDYRSVVVNNPAFYRYYLDNNDINKIRERTRKLLSLTEDDLLVSFFAPPEIDYPAVDEEDHNRMISKMLSKVMIDSNKKLNLLYRPHARGKDYLPEDLNSAGKFLKVIYFPRDIWHNMKVNLYDHLFASDVIISTNSTMSLEIFTAWGRQCRNIPVPIDVTLIDDFPYIKLNPLVSEKRITFSITSGKHFMKVFPKILDDPKKYAPVDAQAKLKQLGWNLNPLETIYKDIFDYLGNN